MKRRIILLALVFALPILPGCGNSNADRGVMFSLYYCAASDADSGSAICAETIRLEDTSVEAVMESLFHGPTDTTFLSSTFPGGTSLQGWELEDGILTLDLSEAFSRLSGLSLIQAEYCIVLTMTQLDGVSSVAITVDGQTIPGAVSGTLAPDDILLDGETEDPVTVSSQLYFPLADGSGLGVEYREFRVSDLTPETCADAVLTELVRGTTQTGMRAFLTNAGTLEVLDIQGGMCVVEMDSQTMSCLAGDENADTIALYALVDSLTELDGINTVSFRLNGEFINGWQESYTAVYAFGS